jgi:Na+/citrate or Na+/malate symporter
MSRKKLYRYVMLMQVLILTPAVLAVSVCIGMMISHHFQDTVMGFILPVAFK